MISFSDVHKTYISKSGDVDALRGISFDIEDGEFVFIIGKSGSGKSTLMKCITCEETPDEGEVAIDGFVISDMSRALVPVLRRHIGMVYQDFRLIESKTVSENIAFAGEIVGIPKKNLNQIVQFMLNLVGLKDKADSYPKELSGGEQQRIAIARAMVNNPKIMVADEPTGNLDPETSENIMAILQEINRGGTTVVVCTHDSNLVDRMKKRVIEIDSGLIVRDKKDSKYSEEDTPKPVVAPVVDNLGFTFGDDPSFAHDRDYSDSFDDEEFEQEIPVSESSFFFGDSPAVAEQNQVEIPEEEEVEVASTEVVDDEDNLVAEVAEENVINAEVVAEEVVEEALSVSAEENATDLPEESTEVDSEEEEAKESTEDKEDIKDIEDDDSWLEEIRLEDSDIDLDIQEDDE